MFLCHFSAVTTGFWQNETLVFLTVGVSINAIDTVVDTACVRYGRKWVSGRQALQVQVAEMPSASSNCTLPTTSRAKRKSIESYQSVELFAINKRGWERLCKFYADCTITNIDSFTSFVFWTLWSLYTVMIQSFRTDRSERTGAIWSGSTLFDILSASFGPVTL